MARPEPTTHRRARLSQERVFRAAVDLADREGLESCAMRRLADELGVGVMSLYYYVSSKDELITGMVDIVFSEIELPSTEVDWKTAVRQCAISKRNALNRHRWAIGLMESQAMPGPASFRVHDAELGYLRGAFSVEMTIQACSVLDAYIYGFALQQKMAPFESADGAAALAEQQAREFDAQAEQQQVAALAEEFPHLAEVVAGHVATVGFDYGEAFEYGLDLILDALERRRETAR